jgi:predicted MFS family arabinose efflux permease
MNKIDSKRGMLALMTAHCAGMVDLIALPIWIGTLVANYHFDEQIAGALVTLFLLGATVASLLFAPLFQRLNPRIFVIIGFALACPAFFLSAYNTSFTVLAILHALGGFCSGGALSLTHGTMGKTSNPHRIFAFAGLAIGIFGIVFMATSLNIIKTFGGSALFFILATIMGLAAVIAALFFPTIQRSTTEQQSEVVAEPEKFSKYIWLCILGISLLAMTQSMTASFFERIGVAQGFTQDQIATTLIIYGIVCIFPAPLAAMLQKRFDPLIVICVGPIFQGIFSFLVTHTSSYLLYTIAGALMVFTILFTHTFAFGFLARIDPTSRAVAATPAMLMFGAAIGPILGGTLVKFFNFGAIGIMACVLVLGQLILFNVVRIHYSRKQLVDSNEIYNA